MSRFYPGGLMKGLTHGAGGGGGGGGASWGTLTFTSQTAFGGFPFTNALDNNTSTLYANNATGETLKLASSSTGGKIGKIRFTARSDNDGSQTPSSVTLQGSNDDTTYTTIQSNVAPPGGWSPGSVQDITFSAYGTNYKYHQFVCTSASGAIAFAEVDVFDSTGAQIAG